MNFYEDAIEVIKWYAEGAGAGGRAMEFNQKYIGSPEALHHKYFSWALEKREGWGFRPGIGWIKGNMTKYNHTVGSPYYVETQSDDWWCSRFQLNPPEPEIKDLTLDEVRKVAWTDTEVWGWNSHLLTPVKGALIGFDENGCGYQIKHSQDVTWSKHCSLTKPGTP